MPTSEAWTLEHGRRDGLMTRNRYIVVLHDGEWKIENDGELSARYRTQEEALLDALNATRRLDRKGQHAEVLTQRADLGLRWNGLIAWNATSKM